VQQAGCTLLRRLCVTAAGFDEAMAAGSVRAACSALATFPRRAVLQAHGLHLLAHLVGGGAADPSEPKARGAATTAHEWRCTVIVDGGALGLASKALASHLSRPSVLQWAVLVVIRVSANSVLRSHTAVAAGLVPSLRKARYGTAAAKLPEPPWTPFPPWTSHRPHRPPI